MSVKVYAGTSAAGSPVQTLTPALAAGAFSATPASLADGTPWRARATRPATRG